MSDYTRSYIETIEAEHTRCGTHIDLNAPVSPASRKLENQIRIMFSSQVATYTSIMNYLGALLDDAGKKWLEARVDGIAALKALERLRNMDVHNEPLHRLIGVSYVVSGIEPAFSETASHEVHLHLALRHRGIGFYPAGLAETKHFSAQPGLVEYLTFDSIWNLAHACIHEVTETLADGIAQGHLEEFVCTLQCEICAASNGSSQTNLRT